MIKKIALLMVALVLLITCMPVSATATDTSNTSQALDISDPENILPVDVFRDPDSLEIRKVYELATNIDPSSIPRESFERDGILYECSDILREVVIGDETKTLTETETVESAKNDMDTILGLLPESKEIATEDGFYGTLLLKPSTIVSEVSGYGSTSKTVSVSRSYPNLSDADTQHIPKTVSESGVTYTLSDVQWQSDNTHNVDDYEITNRYTANATYSGSKSSSYVKGYITTADYVGEVIRTGVSCIRYTVIFSGTVIPEPEPIPEPDAMINEGTNLITDYAWAFIVIPILLALAAILFMIHLKNNKRKEPSSHVQTYERDYPDAYSGDGAELDHDPGYGGQ